LEDTWALAVVGPELQKLGLNIGNQGNTGDQNNNNNQNGNGDQSIVNNNPPISNATGSYGGSGQFDVTTLVNGNTYSGVISANINCAVQQDASNIIMVLTLTPTNVPNSLQQAINVGSSVSFNFLGTTSDTQFNANAQGNAGGSLFDLNLSGSIDQNTLTFTMTASSDSQINASNPHSITLNLN
jgi:hypothetical protein